jgi:hypothetical protein
MLKITATNLVFGTTRQQRLENALYWLRFHLVNLDPDVLPLSQDEVTTYQWVVANRGNAPPRNLKKIIENERTDNPEHMFLDVEG